MDVFSCRVRPGGHIFHEVNKHDVTAAEVGVLRTVHEGAETVYGFVKTGTVKVSDRDEYTRLAETYGIDAVRNMYGPINAARLPTTIDDDFEDATDGAAPAKPKGKGKGKAAQVEPDSDEDDKTF